MWCMQNRSVGLSGSSSPWSSSDQKGVKNSYTTNKQIHPQIDSLIVEETCCAASMPGSSTLVLQHELGD